MNTDVRFGFASDRDLAFLIAHRRHIGEEAMRHCVAEQRVIVARHEAAIVGWLRYGLFWDAIPFMNMLFVVGSHRSQGIGRGLVVFWHRQMHELGHAAVLTSTQSDEQAQHFYRRLGYCDVGGFTLPGEPLEIVFHKPLG